MPTLPEQSPVRVSWVRAHARLLIGIVVVVLVAALAALFFLKRTSDESFPIGTVIDDTTATPETTAIDGQSGRVPEESSHAVAISPKSDEERVVSAHAVWTLSESYDHTIKRARSWSSDAALVYIRSLGPVTLEGKSSGWELGFSSKVKDLGYQIVVNADSVVGQKELPLAAYGGAPPSPWKSLGAIIAELEQNPQYQDASISGASFYLNNDNNRWYYVLATSKGVITITLP